MFFKLHSLKIPIILPWNSTNCTHYLTKIIQLPDTFLKFFHKFDVQYIQNFTKFL